MNVSKISAHWGEYSGTNTYFLIREESGLNISDKPPSVDASVIAVFENAGERLRNILNRLLSDPSQSFNPLGDDIYWIEIAVRKQIDYLERLKNVTYLPPINHNHFPFV